RGRSRPALRCDRTTGEARQGGAGSLSGHYCLWVFPESQRDRSGKKRRGAPIRESIQFRGSGARAQSILPIVKHLSVDADYSVIEAAKKLGHREGAPITLVLGK